MSIAILTLAGLCFIFATLLVLAHRVLHVDEDPRIDAVQLMLPGTNCGACGYPGCLGLSEAIVKGDVLPGKCTVMTEDERDEVAAFMGVDAGAEEKVVARLACAGGKNTARNRATYAGIDSCRGAELVAGGGKACFWGCLGLGECESVCDLDAIYMNEHGLPVVIEDKCTACNDCVEACPKDLFSLHPVSHRLWVACKNLEKGEKVIADCEVGCDACARCEKDAPQGLVAMVNNLPVVDYDRNMAGKPNAKEAIERCPTGAIVWFDEKDGPLTGRAARRVIRQGERQVINT